MGYNSSSSWSWYPVPYLKISSNATGNFQIWAVSLMVSFSTYCHPCRYRRVGEISRLLMLSRGLFLMRSLKMSDVVDWNVLKQISFRLFKSFSNEFWLPLGVNVVFLSTFVDRNIFHAQPQMPLTWGSQIHLTGLPLYLQRANHSSSLC